MKAPNEWWRLIDGLMTGVILIALGIWLVTVTGFADWLKRVLE